MSTAPSSLRFYLHGGGSWVERWLLQLTAQAPSSPTVEPAWQPTSNPERAELWIVCSAVADSREWIVTGLKSGKQVCVIPTPALNLLEAYELSLNGAEAQQPLTAWFPETDTLTWSVLQQAWRQGKLPPLTLIAIERRGPATTDMPCHDPAVLAQAECRLMWDLAALAPWTAQCHRVHALRSMNGEQLHQFTVTLTPETPIAFHIHWSWQTSRTQPSEDRLILSTSQERWELDMSDPWQPRWLTTPPAWWSAELESLPPHEISESLLRPGSWETAVQVLEWFDAVQQSLERGRTVERHTEPVSERTVFKSRMTAWGCGVLLLTLFLMFVYLLIAAALPVPESWLRLGRLLVFSPLVLFLLVQLLLPLARGPQSSDPRASRG
ncbi:MAG: hypothetical protein KatS3mg114_1118 [Planctomycetaceae bacterium]|nr:MAG: hypothetical protein KatS3mg114_1118 [Planctomycetaceae bacterium]